MVFMAGLTPFQYCVPDYSTVKVLGVFFLHFLDLSGLCNIILLLSHISTFLLSECRETYSGRTFSPFNQVLNCSEKCRLTGMTLFDKNDTTYKRYDIRADS